jgi:hypothetical protein
MAMRKALSIGKNSSSQQCYTILLEIMSKRQRPNIVSAAVESVTSSDDVSGGASAGATADAVMIEAHAQNLPVTPLMEATTASPVRASIGEEASASSPHPNNDTQLTPMSPASLPPHLIDDTHVAPMSPATNRGRFHASSMPSSISCDLSAVNSQVGLKFSFAAIVLVVYPPSSNPSRRHVLLADGRGTVGITVWNTHVPVFSAKSVGQLAQFTKVAMTTHNNTRGLVLNKDSTLQLSDGLAHFAGIWWKNLLVAPPLQAILFHDAPENSVVNVAGILGSVCKEDKTVRNAPMTLLTIRLVDRTGVVCIRSWCHGDAQFAGLVDRPVLIKRVRVTAYANSKTGELLDGDGSIITTGFDGSDLEKFWAE